MRKQLVLLAFIFLQTKNAHAVVSISLGYPHKAYRSNITTSTPMLSFQFEKRIHRFGVGAILSLGIFDGYSESLYYTDKQEGGLVIVGLRGNYYLIQKERIEVYAGVMGSVLGCDNGIYLKKKAKTSTVWGSSTIYGSQAQELASDSEGFKGGVQVGAHFWVRPHFGLMAEVSYGTAIINVGIVLRRRA